MITVLSKYVVALRNSPRIYELPFEQVQEWLGSNPTSPFRKNHDSGKRREVIPDLSPAGPNETIQEDGDRGSHDNVGSGYNDGGRADDETGPGNASNPDPEQKYTNHETAEYATKNDFDFSSSLSLINQGSRKRDQASARSLGEIYESPRMQARVPVDTNKGNTRNIKFPSRQKDERRRAASSDWSHTYVRDRE